MVFIVIMGVCGCGKSTVAIELAKKLNCISKDADEFHSKENKMKMANGKPLTDEDRFPWLLDIHHYIKGLKADTGIVTCSALKEKYRKILLYGSSDVPFSTQTEVLFVYLKGNFNVLDKRLNKRQDHFMPPSLLKSQFEILEEPRYPENHLTVDIDQSVESITSCILNRIN